MKQFISKYIKKPEVSFKDMPDAVTSKVTATIYALLFLLLSGLIFSVVQVSIIYFLVAVCVTVVGMIFAFIWYFPFAYNKIIVFEGTITHIDTQENEVIKFLEKHFFYQLKRIYYKLMLDNKQEIYVLYADKKCKVGKRIRIYVVTSSIVVRDNQYYIDNVHMNEFVK